MEITRIETLQRKQGVWLDHVFAFSLYKKELKTYDMEEGNEIDEETVGRIRVEITQKRGIQYLYHLISSKDYTRRELEIKLERAGYDSVDSRVLLQKVEDMRILNDMDYARRYIEQKSNSKSRREMIHALKQKGIEEGIIRDILSESEIDEGDALRKLIFKRLKGRTEIPAEEKNRLYNALMMKGFTYTSIQKILDEMEIRWLY